MDIGVSQIVSQVSSSTTSYFLTYSPLFILISGIVLAIAIIGAILDRLYPEKNSDTI